MNIFLEFTYGERSKWVCVVLAVFMLAFEMGFRTGAFQQRAKDSMNVERIALYCSISEPIDSLTLTVPDTSLWPHVGILRAPRRRRTQPKQRCLRAGITE